MPSVGTKEEKAAYARADYARPENAIKNRARTLCKTAIAYGKLVRLPCEKCGEQRTDAHHDDYSKPLEVRWLCKKCHGLEHRKTHCIRGHALTGDNLSIVIRRGIAERVCVTCRRADIVRFKKRRSEAAKPHFIKAVPDLRGMDMANDRYMKELRKVMQNDNPARPTSRSRAEIEAGIAEISTLLRGPLSNAERLCLVEDRAELRKQLASVSA